MNHVKYRPFPIMDFPQRTWPGKQIKKAPVWCSVDLRDGNQSLEIPMSLEQKISFFQFLVETGFKEIEIGFPSANDIEFQFARTLIESNLIPDDVTIQVLTQSREHLIFRTFESLIGVRKAIVHLYNSTAPLSREMVFQKSKAEVIEMAVSGAALFNEIAEKMGPEHFIFEYSPEHFSQTEMDYAADICNAVLDEWQGREVIINLPFTVESATPNVHADQIEYMCHHLKNRENITISLHAHNDRGTAVAATEMALMAGADRVEGTLFGNGERTGNADIITLAMNLYAQGIDPKLDFSNIDKAIAIYEKSTGMSVHPRHPYAGDLVFTAFSGSHQDAIRKGMKRMDENPDYWAIPYLPIDPRDVGRSYDPIIRINSQSGGSATAYVMEKYYGVNMPKRMQRDFGPEVYESSCAGNKELLPEDVYELFKKTYINLENPLKLINYQEKTNGTIYVSANVEFNGEEKQLAGEGNGLLDAFCRALMKNLDIVFEIKDYAQHSLEYGSRARAITYVEIAVSEKAYYGAGISSNISTSSIKGVISAVNKYYTK